MERSELVKAVAAEALRRRWYGVPAPHYDEWGLYWPPEPAPAPCCEGVAPKSLRRHARSARHVATLAGVDHREAIRAVQGMAARAYLRRLAWMAGAELEASSRDFLGDEA